MSAAAKAIENSLTPAISLRSTVWITLTLALVAVPHVLRLPLWLSALAVAFGAWRLYLARMRLALPPRWLLVLIVIAGAAGILFEYRTLFGRDAGVALLVLMLSLKLMETRTRRDGMVLVFISYFLVITNFFYTQSILTAMYLLVCVWLITAAMIGLQFSADPDAPENARAQMRTAAVMLAQSVPLMLLFFLIFPRVQGPLWGMPSDAFAGITGLSDSMSPGSLNKLVLSDEVAFRAAFSDRVPVSNKLYWRGPVLLDFDGRTWTTSQRVARNKLDVDRRGAPVRYAITLEPHNRRWLFALDMPGMVPAQASITTDYLMLTPMPVTSRMRYEMESHLDYQIGADNNPAAMRRALQLPPGFNPRTTELGQQLRARHSNSEAIMNAALALLRDQKFVYTLEPPLLGKHAVDEFLFETRSGFCEHFSSSFAVLMRAAGIPARVVTGYLGGEYNTLGNYLIVRQSDAHGWTEVWLENRGWVRVDPTSAVSPARADGGLASSMPQGVALPGAMRNSHAILRELAMTLDSLANSWNQTVLGFNLETQRALLIRAGLDAASRLTLAIYLIAVTVVVTLLLVLFTLRNQRNSSDPALAAYQAFCEKTARAGLARRPDEGPIDYAARLAAARPDAAEAVRKIAQGYVAIRYNKSLNINTLRELQLNVRQFAL